MTNRGRLDCVQTSTATMSPFLFELLNGDRCFTGGPKLLRIGTKLPTLNPLVEADARRTFGSLGSDSAPNFHQLEARTVSAFHTMAVITNTIPHTIVSI
jgi:hypothetical protein